MEIDYKPRQKRVWFSSQPSDKDKQVDDKAAVSEKIERDNGNTDMVIGFPVNHTGTDVMGDPAHPCANVSNKLAATWTAPQPLQPAKAPREDLEHGSHGRHIDQQGRNLSPPMEIPHCPIMQSSPYVLDGSAASHDAPAKCRIDGVINTLNRWSKSAEILVDNFLIHMKLGGSISETVWSKLSLGAKIVAEGGIENVFKLSFSIAPTEKLLKTSACYLSTTTGPVAGLLFISTEKLAFCSDHPLSYTTSDGRIDWSDYRVVIPVGRVKAISPCENIHRSCEKYIQVETLDNYEFWFMGFVNYQKALRFLQESVSVH
ncbi:hypothetical protein KI387_033566 [Taxus chinensis]|uniref:GRAM domain-containing protein n=1 Tax=Taxus chinensis TaxID=29808 RepID=A0AA38F1T1_TAXCH|nr:hypothetical protein KI387_033566 [Taxus chinensis]